MRKASVHKIGSDAYRVSFSSNGVNAEAEVITSSDGRARNIKRTFEYTGNVPDGTTPLLDAATA